MKPIAMTAIWLAAALLWTSCGESPPPGQGGNQREIAVLETTEPDSGPCPEAVSETDNPVVHQEGSPDFQLQIKHWRDEPEIPEIVADTDNLKIETLPADAVQPSAESAADTLAAAVGKPGKKFHWSPKWLLSKGIGGVRLPDIAISPDRSVLVVIETVGAASGPFGGRIIAINPENGDILRVYELKNFFPKIIAFVPGARKLVFWSAGQTLVKSCNELVSLDLSSGEIGSAVPAGSADIADLAVSSDGDWIFLKPAGEKEILRFSIDEPAAPPVKIISANANGRFAVNESLLALAGESRLEVFSAEDGRPVKTIAIPTGHRIRGLTFAGRDDWFAFNTAEGRTALVKNKSIWDLSPHGTPLLFFDRGNGWLGVGLQKKNEVCFFKPLDPENKLSRFLPASVRPATRSPIRFMAPLKRRDSFIAIDKAGRFMRLERDKKRWRKSVLLDAAE